MKNKIALLIVLLSAQCGWCQYKPIDTASSVQFSIKNFGFNVGGSFKGLQGTIRFTPDHLADDYFELSIDANTINTDNNMRDNHLRNEDYFDVKNYPRIRFVSTRVTNSTKQGIIYIFGKITIKNITKDISFPFTATPTNGGYLFKGNFELNRKDFKVGGASIISDNLQVSFNIQAN